jgi:hypothetical protein
MGSVGTRTQQTCHEPDAETKNVVTRLPDFAEDYGGGESGYSVALKAATVANRLPEVPLTEFDPLRSKDCPRRGGCW